MNRLIWPLLLGVLGAACDTPDDLGRSEAPNIFGTDDRTEWYAEPDVGWQDVSRLSTVAVIPTERVDVSDPENVVIGSRGTHTDVHELCPGDRFGDQPVSARCSAFVIAPSIVLTAGHCFDDMDDCAESAFVFNWRYSAADTFPNLTVDDVYYCSSVAAIRNEGDFDYAVVNLDRAVESPRRPVPIRYSVDELFYDDPVVTIGHGAGLPLKIDTGGRVVAFAPEFFENTSDTFSGNSGAGVFLPDGTAVGIHVRGPDDYVDMGGCNVTAELDDDPTRMSGGDASHIGLAIQAYCAAGNSGPLCGEEDTLCRSTCDCPVDSICRTEGDAIYCAPRCARDPDCQAGHVCVASRCEPGPGCFAGSLWTRDVCGRPLQPMAACAEAEICNGFACVDAEPGDVCANAMEIAPRTTSLNVDLRELYRDTTRGSCGGHGEDRVWTFELTEETMFRASAREDGWRLYLRRECDDTTTEVACSGDAGVAMLEETLPPGRYFLYIDAAVLATRITIVNVEFGSTSMPLPDAGPMGDVDGGAMADVDAGEMMMMDDGGCGCSTPRPGRTPFVLLLGLLAFGVRRSRRP